MLERLQFWIVYVGSAAFAALLAACLSSPQVGTFRCQTNGESEAERCEPAGTIPTATTAAGVNGHQVEIPEPSSPDLAAAAIAAAQ